MAKKYFWLKLKDDFFQDKRIKKLRRVAGGDTYTVIYLKMQLLSLKNEGLLFYEGVEETFYEELALEIDESEENVQFTIMFLQQNGLLEEVQENQFALIETMNSIGTESQSAERVRKHRELKKEQKALQSNTNVTECNTEKEKDIEKDIEKDKTVHQDELFEQFWKVYPRKQVKKTSKDKFKLALKKYDFETIMKGTYKYAELCRIKNTSQEYIAQCTTFLNQERYLDDYDLLINDLLNNKNTNKNNNRYNPYGALESEIEAYKREVINNDDRRTTIAIPENVDTLF